jgi:hypothetical protein
VRKNFSLFSKAKGKRQDGKEPLFLELIEEVIDSFFEFVTLSNILSQLVRRAKLFGVVLRQNDSQKLFWLAVRKFY